MFRIPKTRHEFWSSKIGGNIERDQKTKAALILDGWRVLEIWECALKGSRTMDLKIFELSLVNFIEGNDVSSEFRSLVNPENII